jgi:hypothetical protein
VSGVGLAAGGSMPKVLAVIQVIEKLPIEATNPTRLSNPIVFSPAARQHFLLGSNARQPKTNSCVACAKRPGTAALSLHPPAPDASSAQRELLLAVATSGYSIDAICAGSVSCSDSTPPRVIPTKNITASSKAIAPSFRGALSVRICLSKSSRSCWSIFMSPIFVWTRPNKANATKLPPFR